jgi:hypothetical protein
MPSVNGWDLANSSTDGTIYYYSTSNATSHSPKKKVDSSPWWNISYTFVPPKKEEPKVHPVDIY